jgi:hypothetical protein
MRALRSCETRREHVRLGASTEDERRGGFVSSEIVGSLERASERETVERRSVRMLAIEALGPLTILGGIVWAILQPYRIVFLDRDGKGFYDYLVQPPLLVIAVGLVFAIAVAPGLVDDLRSARGTQS